MLVEKKALSPEVLEAQTALELPDREMMALINVHVVAVDVIDVNIEDVNVAANVCPNVNVLGTQENVFVTCDAQAG